MTESVKSVAVTGNKLKGKKITILKLKTKRSV